MDWVNLVSSIKEYEVNLYDEIEKICNKIYFVFRHNRYMHLYFSHDKNGLLKFLSLNHSQIHDTYTHYPKFRNIKWAGENNKNCYMKYPTKKKSDINLLNEMKNDLENIKVFGKYVACISRNTDHYERSLCSY